MVAISVCLLLSISQLGWRAGTPEPVLDEDKDFVKLYWKAWENYHAHVVEEVRLGMFPPRFSASGESFEFHDGLGHALFAKWAWRATPCAESIKFALQLVRDDGNAVERVMLSDGSRQGLANCLPLSSLAVWSVYELSGDKAFLKQCLPALSKRNSLYWVNFQNEDGILRILPEMSFLPPQPIMKSDSADALAVLLIDTDFLSRVAKSAGVNQAHRAYDKQKNDLWKRMQAIYHQETGVFSGRGEGNAPVELLSLLPLWVGICEDAPKDKMSKFFDTLTSRTGFSSVFPYPLLSKSHPQYKGDSGVKPLYNYLVLKSLMSSGKRAMAGYTAESMMRNLLRISGGDDILWSEYGPDTRTPAEHAKRNSVDAGYIAIAGLIETILGFDVSAEKNMVTWDIWRTDRHGIKNLRYADNAVSFICERRENRSSQAVIEIECQKPFILRVLISGKEHMKRFREGKHFWEVG